MGKVLICELVFSQSFFIHVKLFTGVDKYCCDDFGSIFHL